ncbi:hypothetical protein Hanom_Chr09g00791831 [Helianthus anomalus]
MEVVVAGSSSLGGDFWGTDWNSRDIKGDLGLFCVFVASLKGVFTILVTSTVIVGGLGFSMLRGCNNMGVIRKQITTGMGKGRLQLGLGLFDGFGVGWCWLFGFKKVFLIYDIGLGYMKFAIGWVRRFYRGWVLQFLRVFAFLEGVVSWLGSVVLWVGYRIRVNCLFDCYKIWYGILWKWGIFRGVLNLGYLAHGFWGMDFEKNFDMKLSWLLKGTIRRGCCWKDVGLEAMSFVVLFSEGLGMYGLFDRFPCLDVYIFIFNKIYQRCCPLLPKKKLLSSRGSHWKQPLYSYGIEVRLSTSHPPQTLP